MLRGDCKPAGRSRPSEPEGLAWPACSQPSPFLVHSCWTLLGIFWIPELC